MAGMMDVVKGRRDSWRRMCGAREQEPGERIRVIFGDDMVDGFHVFKRTAMVCEVAGEGSRAGILININ